MEIRGTRKLMKTMLIINNRWKGVRGRVSMGDGFLAESTGAAGPADDWDRVVGVEG